MCYEGFVYVFQDMLEIVVEHVLVQIVDKMLFIILHIRAVTASMAMFLMDLNVNHH